MRQNEQKDKKCLRLEEKEGKEKKGEEGEGRGEEEEGGRGGALTKKQMPSFTPIPIARALPPDCETLACCCLHTSEDQYMPESDV